MRHLIGAFAVFCLAFAGILPTTMFLATPAQAADRCGGNGAQVVGALLGGIAGGFFGNKADGGRHRSVGTILGVAVGAVAGSKLGSLLNSYEKEEVSKATMASLDSNQTGSQSKREWHSPTRPDVGGAVEVTAASTERGVPCKTTTVYGTDPKTGEEIRQPVKYCRTADNGGWQAVTA